MLIRPHKSALVVLYRKYSVVFMDDVDSLDSVLAVGKSEYAQVPETLNTAQPKGPAENTTSVSFHAGPDRRANATFVMLARNSDLQGALLSVRQLEDRFNRRYNYPYVFLNEEEFSEDFKRCVLRIVFVYFILMYGRFDSRIRVLTPSRVEFGVIPRDHWYQPDWIDKDKADAAMVRMESMNVKYGGTSRSL